MKVIFTFFSLILFGLQPAFSMQNVSDYFNKFYFEYLKARKIDIENRIVLDFLHEISNNKIELIQKILESPQKEERKFAISLIEDEYSDFLENLNFEISFTPNCPLSRRKSSEFKKSHKKFMRQITKSL